MLMHIGSCCGERGGSSSEEPPFGKMQKKKAKFSSQAISCSFIRLCSIAHAKCSTLMPQHIVRLAHAKHTRAPSSASSSFFAILIAPCVPARASHSCKSTRAAQLCSASSQSTRARQQQGQTAKAERHRCDAQTKCTDEVHR